MYESAKIVSITPVKNLKVRLSYSNNYNENDELTPFEEVKDVICLALIKDTEDSSTSVVPMIFNEYIDFAESKNTSIIDMYYAT